MKPEQFAALAELLRLRGGPSQEAARLVLVDGLAPSSAAERAGTSPQAVSNALASCRRGIELARAVTNSDLLSRYMLHVLQCEGTDFIDRLNEAMSSDVEFSADEVAELRRLSQLTG